MLRRRPPRWRKPLRRVLRAAGWLVFLMILASVLAVLTLRWVDPPTSAFMLQREWVGRVSGEEGFRLDHRWVPWEAITPAMALAVVAAEDQRFPTHHGFDLMEIQNALDDLEAGGRVRGASTITQQVAKNLFLWSGRSWVRKALEAYLTALIELTWPKRRILEVYLNIAQFGDRIFGVEAASRWFFGKRAIALTAREAALLAAVLPNPVRLRVDAPSGYVRERAAWIERQARQLGPRYLRGL
jgi:monofunctional biosynthetic peptidoglycan transglycosylase